MSMQDYLRTLRSQPTPQWERRKVLEVLANADAAIQAQTKHVNALKKEVTYLEDSLTAATTGELPAHFDLNQLLMAQRASAYRKWLAVTKDPNDKLRPAGSNDAMPKKGEN